MLRSPGRDLSEKLPGNRVEEGKKGRQVYCVQVGIYISDDMICLKVSIRFSKLAISESSCLVHAGEAYSGNSTAFSYFPHKSCCIFKVLNTRFCSLPNSSGLLKTQPSLSALQTPAWDL